MIIFWRIRYLDTRDKKFKDRDLYLNTQTLDPVLRATIELEVEAKSQADKRAFFKYRPLFQEDNSPGAAERWMSGAESIQGFGLTEYFEDESENELTPNQIARILTGNPNYISVPSGASQHDIDLVLSAPLPLPIAEITLSADQHKIFGYFARDLRELQASAFLRDGPGTLKSVGGYTSMGEGPILETASTDEEIRSFITIFRRLYMSKEPASFQKAVATFAKVLIDHPYGKWVGAVGNKVEAQLNCTPDLRPFVQNGKVTFTQKRLIDIFLYTQYAHQPSPDRQRQFAECLNEVKGKKQLLMWMFLTEVWKCALEMQNAGRVLVAWFEKYCDHYQIATDVLPSIVQEVPGIGAKEKEEVRKTRLFQKRAVSLAMELWEQQGKPAGGHHQFIPSAKEQIAKMLRDGPSRE